MSMHRRTWCSTSPCARGIDVTGRRTLRIAGFALAALAGLVLVGIVLVTWLFDPNDYRSQIQSAFHDATGRQLDLEGDLSLAFVPRLAVDAGAASISNRAGFGASSSFAGWRRARLSVRMWPLLVRRSVELGNVDIEGLQVNLAIARNGENNWSDVLERLRTKAGDKAPGTTPQATTDTSRARLSLTDARLSLTDAQARTSYAIEGLDLETGRLDAAAPFDVQAAFRIARNDRSLGAFDLAAQVDATQPSGVALAGIVGTARLARATGGDPLEVGLGAKRIALAGASRDIRVDALEARVGEATLATTLAVKQGAAGPAVAGTMKVAPTNLRGLLAALGTSVPAPRDDKALGRFAVDARLTYSGPRGLRLAPLTLTLDDTRLAGTVSVPGLERRVVRFDLQGTAIDLDRYLPPPSAKGAVEAPPRAPTAPARNDTLRNLDLQGRLALSRVTVAAIPLEDATAEISLRQGRLSLAPLRARAFGGRTTTRLRYDLAAAQPTLQVDQRFTDVDVADLLGRLVDVHQLEGRGDARFELATRGRDAQALFANVRGPFELDVRDGALIGADLWYEIERALAAAQRKGAAMTAKSTGRTQFERLRANGTISDSTLHNERMQFVTDFVDVKGRGDVDYGRSRVRLDLEAKLLRTPPGRLFGMKVSRLQGVEIPLTVRGTLKEPRVRPDVSGVLAAVAQESLKAPLEKKLKKTLQDLLGR